MKMKSLLATFACACSLMAGRADAIDLTGTWRGVQNCVGFGQNECPSVDQTVNEEGEIAEFDLFIQQDCNTVKAFSAFFEQHYDGLVIDNGCCQGFSLVDCTTNARDLTNPDRLNEVVFFQIIDEDHIVGVSTFTGNDPDAGFVAQSCNFIYHRVSSELPCEVLECCCGLAVDECPAELPSVESCTTTCTSSSSSSSSSSCTSSSSSSSSCPSSSSSSSSCTCPSEAVQLAAKKHGHQANARPNQRKKQHFNGKKAAVVKAAPAKKEVPAAKETRKSPQEKKQAIKKKLLAM